MTIELPPLPYAASGLAPHLSIDTLETHHGKHHKAYVDNVNRLVTGTPYAGRPLEDIVRGAEGTMFDNAAQVWNHTFYWHSMKPGGGGEPTGEIAKRIVRDFGSYAALRDTFKKTALGQFGSGWAWLVEKDGKLAVVATANADTPLRRGQKALLTCDVWEHAYYIDYRNARPDYVANFLANLVNWDFVADNLGS